MKTTTSRRTFIRTLTAGAAALSGAALSHGCGVPTQSLSGSRPNIILIMADDMGFSDIGCYGSEIRTPNIDRLAAEGLRFKQFYNAARCCPTRASLLTGLYPHQAGMGGMVNIGGVDNGAPGPYQGYLNDNCVTLAEVLKSTGYTTLMSGKWHVGEAHPHWPTDRGFDRYFGLISGGANYFDISKTKAEGVTRKMVLDGEPWTPPDDGFYMTDAFSDHAVEFLDGEGRGDNPFFMYVAYTAPHWPLHALEDDIERYRGTYRAGWESLRDARYRRLVELDIIDEEWPLSPLDDEAARWEDVQDKELMDNKMAIYAAQIDRMDQGIGRILDTLRDIGKEENTIVLFLSDNGGCHEGDALGFDYRNNGLRPGGEDSYMSYGRSWANASNTPFRMFKHWVHEGGIATPLVARWPEGIRGHGGLTDDVGHIVDVMATCCDLAGAEYPTEFGGHGIIPLEGKSLVPVLEGGDRTGHDALFWEHDHNKAVRNGKWKLVSKENETWELYDLEADRSELNDVSGAYPSVAADMKELYRAWAEKCGVRE
jgi:arylsulfatase A-like enzyme